jgi:hypothetical protein
MRGIVIFLQWLRPVAASIAMAAAILVGIVFSLVFWSIALLVGGESILDWENSELRDQLAFHRERAQERAVVRAIGARGGQVIGRPVRLAELIDRPMRKACIEGWGAPRHVWLHGEPATMRRKSYRPVRRGMSSDYGEAALAIEFTDGAILALLLPFGRATADFGTDDRFVCADGGKLTFTWRQKGLVTIRGD